MAELHMFGHRLSKRRGDDREASVTLCGREYLDRNKTPDLREFVVDDLANCPDCKRIREGLRPGLAKRFWRWLTRTAYKEPLPDKVIE